jgi:hypothetical protein
VEQQQVAAGQVSQEDLQAIYTNLKADYPAEYVFFDCASIALSQLLPVLRAAMAAWAPLEAPLEWLSVFSTWQPLLATKTAPQTLDDDPDVLPAPDAFTELLMELVYPQLQRATMSGWDATAPGPILVFFDRWAPIMPQHVTRQMLGLLVLPRLQRAAESWDFRTASMLPHAWLHPWLPFLSQELRDLYPGIRTKLAASLQVCGHAPTHPISTTLPIFFGASLFVCLCSSGCTTQTSHVMLEDHHPF